MAAFFMATVQTTFNRRHLLGIRELDAGEITHLLDTAETFRDVSKREIKKVPALRDALTIREYKGRIEGLKVAILGDILHSRVARSNIYLLTKLGANVSVGGPGTLAPDEFAGIVDQGLTVEKHFEAAIDGADVV